MASLSKSSNGLLLLKVLKSRFTKLLKNDRSFHYKVNEVGKNEEIHIYKKRLTIPSAIDYIINNVVYRSDDFIVTSKPYGVGKENSTKLLTNYIPQTHNEIFLKEILPEVALKLGYNYLKIEKIPERFASGLMILSATKSGEEIISEALKYTSRVDTLYSTYITVIVGQPVFEKLETKFAVEIITKNNIKIPTVIEQWSKKLVKKNKIKIVKWKHEIINQSPLASLIKVNISNTSHNSLRLFFATKCLAPVLGDQIFCGRVRNIYGVPLLANPEIYSNFYEEINPELFEKLQMQAKEYKIIPAHIHFQSLDLQISKKKMLNFTVPPPDTFLWTCKQLGLEI